MLADDISSLVTQSISCGQKDVLAWLLDLPEAANIPTGDVMQAILWITSQHLNCPDDTTLQDWLEKHEELLSGFNGWVAEIGQYAADTPRHR